MNQQNTIRESNVEKFIDLWKKQWKEKLQICPDCSGFVIPVCEKALREMLLAQFERIERDTIPLSSLTAWIEENKHQDIHRSANWGMETETDVVHVADLSTFIKGKK